MSYELLLVREPALRFGLDQISLDPREGLFLFGPLRDRRKPSSMRVGVVGTLDGLFAYRQWIKQIQSYIPAPDPNAIHQFSFPGFEAVFKTVWPMPVVELPVSGAEISKKIRITDRHKAIHDAVSVYADAIVKSLDEDSPSVDVWFIVIPDEVYYYGRPLSRVPKEQRISVAQHMSAQRARRLQSAPSLFSDEMQDAQIYLYGIDFHNQLKARLLSHRVTTQIVRESTLSQSVGVGVGQRPRRLQDPATLAWNLCTAAFYKGNGRPWEPSEVREDVCYVGLVFKKTDDDERNACCGAQMFLSSGEGVIFKGAPGRWFSASSREFHLSKDAAMMLLQEVISAYVAQVGHVPKELFIHGQTFFDENEWAGFCEATPSETKIVGVRIRRSSDIKLYRGGRSPVVRGTAYCVGSRKAFLWTSGFVPELDTYGGREVPNPLSVDIVRGDADLQVVLSDIMALTKLNYNACIFGDGLPVTLRFAQAVGEIITSAPSDLPVSPLPFRHYI